MTFDRLGQRLRLAREQARLSQTEVAATLGVTPAALNQYEAGKRRVDALLLDRLSRLYGVPLRFFFGEERARPDWEEALRLRADGLSVAGKSGVGEMVARIRDLEELYRRTGTSFPGHPHPPFAPLVEADRSEQEVAEWAEKARRHYDLGVAPLHDLRGFLEVQGYQIFAVPFGTAAEDLAGLFFQHPELGPVVALNEDQAYTRRPFTLAHELAHGLYHYDRPAILCRSRDQRPLERFADRFASHFLIPGEALHERLRERGKRAVEAPEEIVHLARYFGVSYQAIRWRLRTESRLRLPPDAPRDVRPVGLAQTLGYRVSSYEYGARPWPLEERLPRRFVELAYRAVEQGQLSLRRVAEMLGISDLELEERLSPEGAGSEEEVREEVYA